VAWLLKSINIGGQPWDDVFCEEKVTGVACSKKHLLESGTFSVADG